MGCKGVYNAIRDGMEQSSIYKFSGKKCGIDGYAWLHKAVFTDLRAATEGKNSSKIIGYMIKKLQFLISANIEPVVVFDGNLIKSKEKTTKDRTAKREGAKQKSLECKLKGDKKGEYKYLGASVSITWTQVEAVIDELRKHNFDYIVAPFEADAELGYLNASGYVDFVIAEDSDILLYGATVLVSKLENDGSCVIISVNALLESNVIPKNINTLQAWVLLCCLSGCDYTDGVKGLGIKKGVKPLVSALCGEIIDWTTEDEAIKDIFYRVLECINYDVESKDKLCGEMYKSYLTFKYHKVYDPITHSILNVSKCESSNNDIIGFMTKFNFIDNLHQFVKGDINPSSGAIRKATVDTTRAKPEVNNLFKLHSNKRNYSEIIL